MVCQRRDGGSFDLESDHSGDGTDRGTREAELSSGLYKDFSQLSLQTARLNNPAELILFLEDCLRGELGHIARAKGVVPVGGEMLRFDLADRQYAITGSVEGKPQCVIIGTELQREELFRRLGTSAEEEALQLSWQHIASGIKRNSTDG